MSEALKEWANSIPDIYKRILVAMKELAIRPKAYIYVDDICDRVTRSYDLSIATENEICPSYQDIRRVLNNLGGPLLIIWEKRDRVAITGRGHIVIELIDYELQDYWPIPDLPEPPPIPVS